MDIARFSRQIIIPEFGVEGQILLNRSKVFIIGLGGLGSVASIYLALGGVGTLGIMDFDKVDITNLQRQPLYEEEDIGNLKTEVAEKKLKNYNKNLNIKVYNDYFSSKYKDIIKDYDLILDCTDNISTRKEINLACLETNKPFLYCSIDQFTIQLALLNINNGPCYECIFPDLEDSPFMSCLERGVLGPVAGIAGIYQSLEAIKYLSNMNFLKNQILFIDLLQHKKFKLNLKKNQNCICNQYKNEFIDRNKNKIEEIPVITIKEIQNNLENLRDMIFIDLRENSHSIDISKILGIDNGFIEKNIYKIHFKNILFQYKKLPKDKTVILICSSGAKAKQAGILLKQLNFSKVFYLKYDEFIL